MIGLNTRLRQLEEAGGSIRVGIIGAGQMGRGMVSQIMLMRGMIPAILGSNKIEDVILAYREAGVKDEDILVARKLSEVNSGMERGKFIATDRSDLVSQANLVDVVVDATGVIEAGARFALDAIENKKHIVMLNVEADVVIGSILKKKADEAGIIYTGSAGDEPGVVKELYDFSDALGFEIVAIGKGKNNPIDYESNPDKAYEEGKRRGINPRMLASFKDGTKTMIEMAAMANSTGLTIDKIGGHGVKAELNGLPQIFQLKEEGGILTRKGIVDYVDGVAPGVFAIVSSSLPQVHHIMNYVSMGDGPNYVLFRPYHLTSLETPISVARAALYKEATIAPLDGKFQTEVITVAKKDLKKGDYLDGIGGFTVYGTLDSYENSQKEGSLPLGLVNEKTRLKIDVKKGQIISYDMVELDEDSLVYKLRLLQDQYFNQ